MKKRLSLISCSFTTAAFLLVPQLSSAAGEAAVKLLDSPPAGPLTHYSTTHSATDRNYKHFTAAWNDQWGDLRQRGTK